MPNVLSRETKNILKLLHQKYKPQTFTFDENGYVSRKEFTSFRVLQGKTISSEDLNIQAKQVEWIAMLLKEGVQYIIFCDAQSEPMYKVFKENNRFDVLFLGSIEKIKIETVVKLHAITKGKKANKTYFLSDASSSYEESVEEKADAFYLISGDGLNENGIVAFALYCYEKICALTDYPVCGSEDLAKILLSFEDEYKKFNKSIPIDVSGQQFVSAIELAFRLMRLDLGEKKLTETEIDEIFQQIASNFKLKVGQYLEERSVAAIEHLSSLIKKPQDHIESIGKVLKRIGHYLKVMEICFDDQSTQVQQIAVNLSEKFQAMLLQQSFEFFKTLKQRISGSKNIGELINEAMAVNYEKSGNEWIDKKAYSEAKSWLMLAYVLTNNLEREARLWDQLAGNIFPLTSKASVSNLGTKARSVWHEITSLFLANNSDTSQLKLYDFHGEIGRRIAGKLFSLHCQMFICVNQLYKEPLVSEKESGFLGSKEKSFVLNDKAILAFQYLIVYLKKLQQKNIQLTNKMERLFVAFKFLLDGAKELSEDSQDYLYKQLESMKLPQEYLALFPHPGSKANSFYIAVPSSTPSLGNK